MKKIIEVPFKYGDVFEFDNSFYEIVNQNNSCLKCDLYKSDIDCFDFNIKCRKDFIFKKIENIENKYIIKIPFEHGQIFKLNNNYYTSIKGDDNNCTKCSLYDKHNRSAPCFDPFFYCDDIVFKKLDEYEILFFNKGDKDK